MSSLTTFARVLSRRGLLSTPTSRLCLQRPSLLASPPMSQNFSTAAEPAKKTKSKRRRTLEAKDPILVTERAADRIKELLSGENAEGAIGITLGVKRRK